MKKGKSMIILQDVEITRAYPEKVVKPLQGWLETIDPLDRDKEHVIVLTLNVRNKVTCVDVVGTGLLDFSFVHPREVFRRAIAVGAAKIILAHNHPSLSCEPSEDDILCTRRVLHAGEIIGIPLLDHIIFCPTDHYSFVEHGRVF